MPQRTLSSRTKALLEQLRGPARSLMQIVHIGDSSAGVLDQLGVCGEPLVLPYVLPYVFDRRRSVSRAAARAAAVILRRLPVADVPWLDERLRERSTWYPGWFDMAPADLGVLARFEPGATALLRLATCHPSGYVREAALSALGPIGDGSEVPFVLIRLNDWVPPVRDLALRLIRERTSPAHARNLVLALPLIMRLQLLRRVDHAQTITSILAVLCQRESREALLEGTRADDRQTRRLAYRLAAENGALSTEELFDGALADDDPLVRLWVAQHAADSLPDNRLASILEILERDSFMAVRREALDLRLARLPGSAEAKLRECLFDRSIGVRSHCQYHLRRRFQHDPGVDYRRAIEAETICLAYAILGLGEVGESSDVARVEPYLGDPRNRVRAAAVRAVGRLSKEALIPSLLRALQDESAVVSREGGDALQRIGWRVPADALGEIYRSATHRHVRKNTLRVLAKASLWDGLPILIAASAEVDDQIRRLGRAFLSRWLVRSNRGQVIPTPDQLRRAREALNAHAAQMDSKQVSQLEFILRTALQ